LLDQPLRRWPFDHHFGEPVRVDAQPFTVGAFWRRSNKQAECIVEHIDGAAPLALLNVMVTLVEHDQPALINPALQLDVFTCARAGQRLHGHDARFGAGVYKRAAQLFKVPAADTLHDFSRRDDSVFHFEFSQR